MSDFIRSRLRAFHHAFRGLWYVIKTQRNAWIHVVVTILVVALSFWLGISTLEWVGLILTIAFVWMAEIINTALEAVVDLASPQHHPLAKVGKDVGAAAVLIAALTAALVGVLILGPALWERLFELFGG